MLLHLHPCRGEATHFRVTCAHAGCTAVFSLQCVPEHETWNHDNRQEDIRVPLWFPDRAETWDSPEGCQVLRVSHGGVKATREGHVDVEAHAWPRAHLWA